MSQSNSNPFSVIRSVIGSRLQKAPTVISHISEGNLLMFDTNEARPRPAIATADVPELAVHMSGIRGSLHSSSSHLSLTSVWEFQVSTGDWNSSLNLDISWALIEIFSNWRVFAEGCIWKDKTFIKDIKLSSSALGVSNPDANRNIKGFASVAAYEFDLSLDLKDIKA